jgi:hypothetical protein
MTISRELEALEAFRHHLNWGVQMPEDGRRLLLAVLDKFFQDEKNPSLDRLFGVRQRGGTTLRRDYELRRRDWFLCRLWRVVPEWEFFSPAEAARKMAAAAENYGRRRWPRERNDLEGPNLEPALTWWRILQMGQKIPGEKRIAQILRQEIQRGRLNFPSSPRPCDETEAVT